MSDPITTRKLWSQGLWSENPGLVKLLGLCPLLAVSNNMVNGLGLGLATLLTLVIANGAVSSLRSIVTPAIRIPLYVLIIASTVTLIELFMRAWLPALHAALGIFLPLIVTNCLIIGRSEAFASRHDLRDSLHDACAMGLGFLWVLVILGGIRELIGQGTLFDNAYLLFGESARFLTLHVFAADHGMLIALLPPGAFFALGLLLAGKNWIDSRRAETQSQNLTAASPVSPPTAH
ncbi:electron transport complex subunit E [Granulosicoccus antarcticus]|uniref:Ion-translocating oxidoreductase complex subunit E n=1 Tax=Granulosicoccus antarcticus IMCC3135 TaxID=1192854 RepID=A0A2Z2NK89_9GAMM|nr:electron transport complex subunit E [Granulosicoccus antarcticus]ASJ70421.1 Electron transport complex subunit RnfE [Granulosicoccus antarcticus IMCC3135]